MFGLVISIVCLLLVVSLLLGGSLQNMKKMSDHARQKSGYQESEVEVMGAIRLKPLS